MTIAFVHGVPETDAVWDAFRAELGEESVTLSMPGFGAPLPDAQDSRYRSKIYRGTSITV